MDAVSAIGCFQGADGELRFILRLAFVYDCKFLYGMLCKKILYDQFCLRFAVNVFLLQNFQIDIVRKIFRNLACISGTDRIGDIIGNIWGGEDRKNEQENCQNGFHEVIVISFFVQLSSQNIGYFRCQLLWANLMFLSCEDENIDSTYRKNGRRLD